MWLTGRSRPLIYYLTCRDQVDPLLYGEEPKSARDEDDYDDVIEALRGKLEELQVFKESYEALNVRLRVRERERERERETERERQRDGRTDRQTDGRRDRKGRGIRANTELTGSQFSSMN